MSLVYNFKSMLSYLFFIFTFVTLITSSHFDNQSLFWHLCLQANGSAKRAGEGHKTTSPTIPASKIPAFYPSSAKGNSSQSAPNSDATNPITLSSSFSLSATCQSLVVYQTVYCRRADILCMEWQVKFPFPYCIPNGLGLLWKR